ncbi:MAG TPA: hypothetical protein VNA14_11725 [Mycobacteriales bacterium]|nr:hypothetical protein [Mycobacteriales bacterium]
MRTALTVPIALALVAALPAPAPATPGVVVLDCTLTYAAYGVGSSSGSGTCTATGTHTGTVALTFWTDDPAATCPVVGQAVGSVSGAVNGLITWQRPASTVTLSNGDHNGTGTLTHAVTSPAGNPCGGTNVSAHAVFTIAGA